MNKATITLASPIFGEQSRIIEHRDLAQFYAAIVGTIQGALKSGSTITALTVEENLA